MIAERKHGKVRPSTFKYDKMFESISKVTSIILGTNKIFTYHGAGFESTLSYIEK